MAIKQKRTKQTKFRTIRRSNARLRRKRKMELVVTPESFRRADDGTATVTVTLATQKPVRRYDGIYVDGQFYDQYDEVLLMRGLDATRIKGKRGIPFLNAHQAEDIDKVLGRSVPETLVLGEDQCTLDFKLGKRAAARGYVDDIENGILADTSVGYCINAYNLTLRENNVPLLEATNWTVYENSCVPVPADEDAVIRSKTGKRARAEGDVVDEEDDVEGDDTSRGNPDDEGCRAGEDDEDGDEGAGGGMDDGDGDEGADPEDEERGDGEMEDDLEDDASDTEEEREEKARARELLAKIRARKEERRNGTGFVVLDPERDPVVRQLMDDAKFCGAGVFRKVDAMRRNGAPLAELRLAMRKAYLDVGTVQERSRIASRPDASAARQAEDGPADLVRSAGPTDAEIRADVRRRKMALRR